MECGLLGRKLGHSYSPQIHAILGSYSYRLFEVEPEELESFLRGGSFQGLNVTIPYKKAVIPFLAELSPTARKLGAVNTIVRRPDGSLIGHNTDYAGFRSMAQRSGLVFPGKKVLVLGSGGASNTVRMSRIPPVRFKFKSAVETGLVRSRKISVPPLAIAMLSVWPAATVIVILSRASLTLPDTSATDGI